MYPSLYHSLFHGNSCRFLLKYFTIGVQNDRSHRPSLLQLAHGTGSSDAAALTTTQFNDLIGHEAVVARLEELQVAVVGAAKPQLALLALMAYPVLRLLFTPVEASLLTVLAHADVHVLRPLVISAEVLLLFRGVAVPAVVVLLPLPKELVSQRAVPAKSILLTISYYAYSAFSIAYHAAHCSSVYWPYFFFFAPHAHPGASSGCSLVISLPLFLGHPLGGRFLTTSNSDSTMTSRSATLCCPGGTGPSRGRGSGWNLSKWMALFNFYMFSLNYCVSDSTSGSVQST